MATFVGQTNQVCTLRICQKSSTLLSEEAGLKFCTMLNFYSTWPRSSANVISHIGSSKKMGRATVLIWIKKRLRLRVLIKPHASLGYRTASGMLVLAFAVSPVALRRPASQTTLVKRPTLGLWN